jgi:hypothetical protein
MANNRSPASARPAPAGTLPFSSWANDDKPWVLGLSLDSPDLTVPAVQWSIFNEDPVPQFKERLKRNRPIHQKLLKNTENEGRMRSMRAVQISNDWDRAFRKIPGDKVYMLTGEPLHSQGYSSDGGDAEIWIVTKTVSVHGTPVCWSLHVEVHEGENPQFKLTEKNRVDLLALYESVMTEAPAER